MRNFKKRTVALVLASVITVAGSFASDRYKDSLMGLSFENSESGMHMVVHTKMNFSGNLTPLKRDAETYVLTLPEMNSQAPTPDLTNNPYVRSVNIRTMPYTNNGTGYTRITIKTNNLQTLPVQHRVYLPGSESAEAIQRLKQAEQEKKVMSEQKKVLEEDFQRQQEIELMRERLKREEAIRKAKLRQEQAQREAQEVQEEAVEPPTPSDVSTSEPFDISKTKTTRKENNEAFMLVMGILLVLLCSIYFFIKAKGRMVELSGESLDLDITEEKKKPAPKANTKKINKIKNTIKTLDNTYSKSAAQRKAEYASPIKLTNNSEPIEEVNVVDLDELFQEQVNAQKKEQLEEDDAENMALEDFLSGFSFDEEYGTEDTEEPEEELYNIELYEEILNGGYKFNDDDIDCINQLMQTEIADETIRNIKNYLVSNPIKPKAKDKILEELVATYAITQNINFTQKDVEALYKIMNVEIDSDFITDLRTNPQRTKEVEEEIIKSKGKIQKPTEITTLKVSEALPDLSEALQKQGDKKIESSYKPQTVYFSEGYDVSTLSISEGLPDLSKELDKSTAYVSKPSAKIDLVDNSYEVETLSISSNLPDLSDVLKNPKNYETKEEVEVKVDEKALLDNISQVQFKPFDDNKNDFEVLNDFDDFYAVDESDPNDVLTFEEIAAEFEELYSIKITNDNELNENNVPTKANSTQEEADVSTIEKELARFFGVENIVNDEQDDIVYTLREEQKDELQEKAEQKVVEEPRKNIEQKVEPLNTDVQKIEKAIVQEVPKKEDPLVKLEQREKKEIHRERSKLSESVLNKIQEKRAQRDASVTVKREIKEFQIVNAKEKSNVQTKICVIENESYDVLSSVSFVDNLGCHLAKNSKGYVVVGYIGDKLFQIKTYETLKSEKIQARMSEKLENGALRFIVRIGTSKFILDVEDKNIKFVMDLC